MLTTRRLGSFQTRALSAAGLAFVMILLLIRAASAETIQNSCYVNTCYLGTNWFISAEVYYAYGTAVVQPNSAETVSAEVHAFNRYHSGIFEAQSCSSPGTTNCTTANVAACTIQSYPGGCGGSPGAPNWYATSYGFISDFQFGFSGNTSHNGSYSSSTCYSTNCVYNP